MVSVKHEADASNPAWEPHKLTLLNAASVEILRNLHVE